MFGLTVELKKTIIFSLVLGQNQLVLGTINYFIHFNFPSLTDHDTASTLPQSGYNVTLARCSAISVLDMLSRYVALKFSLL